MKNLNTMRLPLVSAILVGVVGLSACSSIGYRCPLDADEDAEYPTACASMEEAIAGAKKGTGGKTSVLMDDKGRLIPPELLQNKVAKPLTSRGAGEPYRNNSGDPVFHQPKVFQVWSSAFVDAEGNLHDGHHAWFSTPGRWAYGTVDRPSEVGSNTMRPALPDTRPSGRIVKVDPRTGREVAQQQPQAQAPAQNTAAQSPQQERDKAALQTLSSAANSAAANARTPATPTQNAGAVTVPAVQLAN